MSDADTTPFKDALWIEAPWRGSPSASACVPFFKQTFAVPAEPAQATLYITALGLFDAEINGKPVCDHVFAPGWTNYHKRVRYLSLDVTALLNEGTNALGVLLGDGWYAGHVANHYRQVYGEQPRLLARLEWQTKDGTVGQVCSAPDWQCGQSSILQADLLMGEACDARLNVPGWSTVDPLTAEMFTPRNWTPPESLALTQYDDPPVRRMEVLPGKVLSGSSRPGVRYDFAVNLVGRLRIRVKGPRGATLRMLHAEVLNPDGSLYTENLRTARATDFYTLHGEGWETWEPRFTFHGFRYASIESSNWNGLEIAEVEAVVLYTDIPETGRFTCSHPLLNQLYTNILRSQKGNYLEVPTDCPQRDERLGWTGDAQVFLRTACFNSDVRGFFRKWLRDLRDTQAPNGAIPPFIPSLNVFNLESDGGPAWADAALICPWTLYEQYGDLSFIDEAYESMTAYMRYLENHKVRDHIRSHPAFGWGGFGDWLALDGSGKSDGGTPKDLIGTAFYANNARILARSAELLGKPDEARAWRNRHAQIVDAFQRRFVTPDGFLAAGTQTAYVLALHFELLRPEQRAAAADRLVELIRQNGTRLSTGFVSSGYLLHVLEACGEIDLAYALLEQTQCPSWLFAVTHGATSIWERWDGWTPDKGFQNKSMNSFNHYAYGAVGDWLVSSVAGLVPDEPGFSRIRFKPRPGGSLTQASARLVTPHGPTRIAWSIENDVLQVTLEVPPGTEAIWDGPTGWDHATETRLPPGEHTLVLARDD